MAGRPPQPNSTAPVSARSAPLLQESGFYDNPAWYDLVHAQGTLDDIRILERLNRDYGTGGPCWLEPACGTGRYLAALARRRYRVTGYDLNQNALAYARRRLRRYGRRAVAVHGDMTTFTRHARYDLAFNLINTFRHLLDESQAAAHLKCIARSLRPGGIYVLGLDLLDYRRPDPVEDVWKARRGILSAQHVMMAIPPERAIGDRLSGKAHECARRERIVNFLTVSTPRGGSRMFESAYELRTYDLRELLATLARSPLEVIAAFHPGGAPIALNERTRDVLLVLKTR